MADDRLRALCAGLKVAARAAADGRYECRLPRGLFVSLTATSAGWLLHLWRDGDRPSDTEVAIVCATVGVPAGAPGAWHALIYSVAWRRGQIFAPPRCVLLPPGVGGTPVRVASRRTPSLDWSDPWLRYVQTIAAGSSPRAAFYRSLLERLEAHDDQSINE